jgi:hypothetical protein
LNIPLQRSVLSRKEKVSVIGSTDKLLPHSDRHRTSVTKLRSIVQENTNNPLRHYSKASSKIYMKKMPPPKLTKASELRRHKLDALSINHNDEYPSLHHNKSIARVTKSSSVAVVKKPPLPSSKLIRSKTQPDTKPSQQGSVREYLRLN